MKIFQKIKLSLLITLAITTQASAATELTVNVGTASTMSGAQDYDIMHKTGSAALTLSSTGNDIGTLDIQNGTVQISAATNLVPSGTTPVVNFSGGGAGSPELDITATISTPIAVTFAEVGSSGETSGASGTINVATGCTATVSSIATSSAILTVAGAGTLNTDGSTNNSESNTGITVAAGATLGVVAANNLTTATTLNGGTLMPTNTMTIASPIALIADSYVQAGSGVAATLSSALTGARTLTANGTGTLALTADNSDSATGLKVNSGTLSISLPNQLPAATSQAVTLNGGTLQTTASLSMPVPIALDATSILDVMANTVTQSNAITGSGTLNLINSAGSGNGTLTLSSDNSPATSSNLRVCANTILSVASDSNIPGGTLTLVGGTLGISAGYTSTKGITVSANSSVSIPSGGNFTYGGTISGSAAHTLSLIGGGTFTLNADNSSNSNTALSVGSSTTLKTTDITTDSVASSSADYLPGSATGLILNGGTLQTTATSATTAFNLPIVLAATSTLDAWDSSAANLSMGISDSIEGGCTLNITNTTSSSTGSGTVMLGGNNSVLPSTLAVARGSGVSGTAGTVRLSISSATNLPFLTTIGQGCTLKTTTGIDTIGARTVTMFSGSILDLNGGTFAVPLSIS